MSPTGGEGGGEGRGEGAGGQAEVCMQAGKPSHAYDYCHYTHVTYV